MADRCEVSGSLFSSIGYCDSLPTFVPFGQKQKAGFCRLFLKEIRIGLQEFRVYPLHSVQTMMTLFFRQRE
jgi:hypothetical protein